MTATTRSKPVYSKRSDGYSATGLQKMPYACHGVRVRQLDITDLRRGTVETNTDIPPQRLSPA